MMFGQELNNHRILKRLAKALIRLRVCAGWSEPLLVAHTTLLEISCTGRTYHIVGNLMHWLIYQAIDLKHTSGYFTARVKVYSPAIIF